MLSRAEDEDTAEDVLKSGKRMLTTNRMSSRSSIACSTALLPMHFVRRSELLGLYLSPETQ